MFIINEKSWPYQGSKIGQMSTMMNIESFETTPQNVFSQKAKISIADIVLFRDVAMAWLKSPSH